MNRFFHFGIAGYVWMGAVVLILIGFILAFASLHRRRRQLMEDLGVKHQDKALRRLLTTDLQFWAVALNRLSVPVIPRGGGEPLAFSRRVRHSSAASEDALESWSPRPIRCAPSRPGGAGRGDPARTKPRTRTSGLVIPPE